MRFRIERDTLTEAVAWAARALPNRPVLPILSGLLLTAGPDGLTLSCFDYEVSARIRVEADVAEPGTVLVPGRLLAEITRSLPALPVEVEEDSGDITLTCGAASFSLVTMPVEEYPRLPDLPRLGGTVDGGALAAAISQVVPAASRDDTLSILTGVNVELTGDVITLAATDRYRLAMRELAWTPADPGIRATLLVPARTLAEAARMMTPGVPVQVMLRGGDRPAGAWPKLAGDGSDAGGADAMIGFECGGRRLTTRLVAGEFIKYKTKFPAEFGCRGDIPATQLAEAVKRVALVAERGSAVRLSFGQGQVTIEAGTAGQARARETVTAEFEGDVPAIAFNPHYLLDGLGAALTAAAEANGDARIRLQFTNPTRPAVITGASPERAGAEPDFRYLVVPLRALASALLAGQAVGSRQVGMARHPGHHQQHQGEREQQEQRDDIPPRLGLSGVAVLRVGRRRGVRRAWPGQIGHQLVELPLGPGGERAVDPLGQLVEGEPPGGEVLPQGGHRLVPLGVPDAQFVPVSGVPGHVPSGHTLPEFKLLAVCVVDHRARTGVVSHRHRVPGFARLNCIP
jgi:DNA polymerase III subunit beta